LIIALKGDKHMSHFTWSGVTSGGIPDTLASWCNLGSWTLY